MARESGLSLAARKELRQQKAPAISERLHRFFLELDPARKASPVLPKIQLGTAICYTMSQWEELVRYLEDGRYETDMNQVDPVAAGRSDPPTWARRTGCASTTRTPAPAAW